MGNGDSLARISIAIAISIEEIRASWRSFVLSLESRYNRGKTYEGECMDFRTTPQLDLFGRTIREFAEKNVAPRSREIDRQAQGIPEEILQGMVDLGLFGLTIPEQYGGTASPGEELVYAMTAVHEIARADLSMSLPVYYLLNLGWGFVLSRYGSEQTKREVLPHVAKGEWFIGIATTEPSGGSDLANIKTNATKKDGKYVLNGEKIFVSGIAEGKKRGGGHLTLFKTAPELGYKGETFAYVPIQSSGITTTFFDDMGRMGLSTGGIAYKNVEIPTQNVVGQENRGFYMAMEGFNAARILVCAACTGGAERALEITRDYTKQRVLFGQPLAKFEASHSKSQTITPNWRCSRTSSSRPRGW
jgi:acyl-CoA dehydrogenase